MSTIFSGSPSIIRQFLPDRAPGHGNAFFARLCFAVAMVVVNLVALDAMAGSSAQAQTRSLKLYYIHTGERATITFKKNGKYIQSGLTQINRFLRDWRRNEPTKMDPKLLDLIWEVYQKSGSKQSIHVISGYRSPNTNNMLRRRGRGVAKHSQHTLGKAMDFFLPDVKLSKLREIGLKMGVGGVGYYPTSGSPFVHMDTGRVRHWPRMTRAQLVKVFPDGKTLHVPTDGKPLKGYDLALAEYNRTGRTSKAETFDGDKKKGNNFFKKLLGGADEEEDNADSQDNGVPAPKAVKASPVPKPSKPETPAPVQAVPVPEAPVAEPATPAAPAAPVPAAPVAPATQLASLPRNAIPVPTLAPRGGSRLSSGSAIAFAPPAPEIAPTQQAVPVPAEGLTAESKPDAARDDSQIALANIPLPQRRPKLDPVKQEPTGSEQQDLIAALENPAKENAPELAKAYANSNQEAAASGKNTGNGGNIQVAALSPQEIQLLRQSARPANPLENATAQKSQANAQPATPESADVENGFDQAKTNPAATIKMAKLKANGMVQRPISIEKSAADEKNTVGKWALSGEKSLGDISDMTLPTYGNNALRELPKNPAPKGFVSAEEFKEGKGLEIYVEKGKPI